jgi:hypothetical protein
MALASSRAMQAHCTQQRGLASSSRASSSSSSRVVRPCSSSRKQVVVQARQGRGDRRRPPPPDLPSLLFDQRIVYLGMPVSGTVAQEAEQRQQAV